MDKNSRSVEISAPPESVWATWSDTSTWPTWNPDVQSVDLSGPLAEGATGTMTTKSGGTHKIQVTDVIPGREFTVHSDIPMPATKVHFRCLVEASGSGSRASQGARVSGLMSFMGGAMMGRILPTFDALLQGLKAHVEAKV